MQAATSSITCAHENVHVGCTCAKLQPASVRARNLLARYRADSSKKTRIRRDALPTSYRSRAHTQTYTNGNQIPLSIITESVLVICHKPPVTIRWKPAVKLNHDLLPTEFFQGGGPRLSQLMPSHPICPFTCSERHCMQTGVRARSSCGGDSWTG